MVSMQIFSLISKEILKVANSKKAKHLQKFFKTGKGEYGEGDVFLGLTNPQQRQIVKQFKKQIDLDVVGRLIDSQYHEFRLVGLLLLVELFTQQRKKQNKGLSVSPSLKELVDFYFARSSQVNNWDLVDLSAPKIPGPYFFEHQNELPVLYEMAKKGDLWQRRIAMLSMFAFIREGQFDHPLQIAEILVDDSHDLIHKAVGWMLREIGKRDQSVEEDFLSKYHKTMPRTMLRYAIEKFDPEKRAFYMGK